MQRATFELIERFMLSCMDDSAHDAEHIYRVLSNALGIAREETGVNYDILIAACLLHDIGRPDQIRSNVFTSSQRNLYETCFSMALRQVFYFY